MAATQNPLHSPYYKRPRKILWSVAAQHSLINRTKVHRILWDFTHENFSKKIVKKAAWRQVAADLRQEFPDLDAVDLCEDDVQSKFTNIKTTFQREVRKLIKTPIKNGLTTKWEFFKSCSFMLEIYYNSYMSVSGSPSQEDDGDMLTAEAMMIKKEDWNNSSGEDYLDNQELNGAGLHFLLQPSHSSSPLSDVFPFLASLKTEPQESFPDVESPSLSSASPTTYSAYDRKSSTVPASDDRPESFLDMESPSLSSASPTTHSAFDRKKNVIPTSDDRPDQCDGSVVWPDNSTFDDIAWDRDDISVKTAKVVRSFMSVLPMAKKSALSIKIMSLIQEELSNVYTVEERVFIVRTFWALGSYEDCQRKFRNKFKDRVVPSKSCIKKLVKRLETTGNLFSQRKKDLPKMSYKTLGEVQQHLSALQQLLDSQPTHESPIKLELDGDLQDLPGYHKFDGEAVQVSPLQQDSDGESQEFSDRPSSEPQMEYKEEAGERREKEDQDIYWPHAQPKCEEHLQPATNE